MADKDIILEVRDLKKYFKSPTGTLHAVDGVNFSIRRGETLGLVGESGCGKSTIGRLILGLHQSTSGEILFNAKAQSRAELDKEVSRLMDVVGLSARLFNAYPHELDGGRRQRVGIARALSLQPQFIVCDEPVSSLDVSIQAQVLNLLKDLQAEFHLTYLFITHDLSVVKFFSDKIAVMYLGQLVETADSAELFRQPLHPYSQALLSAIPIPSSRQKMQRMKLIGELQSPIDPEPGCRFAKRCLYAREGCTGRDLALRDFGSGHFCACCRAGALEEQTPSK